MNVSLTHKQEKYIAAQLENGGYENASEVVRDALRLHQSCRQSVIENLRVEIARGWEGETSNRTVEDIIKDKITTKVG